MNRSKQVRIAGAGPAGLSAALVLARAGISVEVRERCSFVGARFRDSVHGIENWTSEDGFAERLRGWGLDLGRTLTPCHELLLCNDGACRRVRFRSPLFYLVVRGPDPGYLEAELLRGAREAGATIKFGDAFTEGEVDLDATGPASARRVCVEVGIKFRTGAPNLAVGLISARATPAGYAYLLIHEGRASLCAVRFDGQSVDQAQLRECERLL
ncbi:MAG TPA: FAD-dependent monooxygenase, partial [Polyangiaceae bacterium]|nr:FAD-dependent monooxygenase [Polyangiaceae bacterium]